MCVRLGGWNALIHIFIILHLMMHFETSINLEALHYFFEAEKMN